MSDRTLHAILGASSAERWMNCAASIALIAEYYARGGKEIVSRYAQEGTAAHHLGELSLRLNVIPHTFIGQYMTVRGELLDIEPDDWPEDNPYFEIDDDMADAVQVYCTAIHEQAKLMEDMFGLQPIHFLEKSFDLNRIYPGMFGTNDYSLFIISEMLIVIDYKHGRGKVVEVEENAQLLYYALGAILEVCKKTSQLPKIVRIMIVQPRAAHRDGPVRYKDYSVDRIQAFAKELVAKAKITERDDNIPVPGDWCQFCTANGTTCHAVQERASELAMTDFADLSEEETGLQPIVTVETLVERTISKPGGLSKALRLAPMLDAYVRGIQAYAQHEAENGRPICDENGNQTHKLVRRRSNRRLKREAETSLQRKIAEGVVTEEEVYNKKLKSPAQLEKTKLGKKYVATIAEQPPGGITLASIEDSRQEVIMNPFADLTDEDMQMSQQLQLVAPSEDSEWNIL